MYNQPTGEEGHPGLIIKELVHKLQGKPDDCLIIVPGILAYNFTHYSPSCFKLNVQPTDEGGHQGACR